jgi:hypothetical protein
MAGGTIPIQQIGSLCLLADDVAAIMQRKEILAKFDADQLTLMHHAIATEIKERTAHERSDR